MAVGPETSLEKLICCNLHGYTLVEIIHEIYSKCKETHYIPYSSKLRRIFSTQLMLKDSIYCSKIFPFEIICIAKFVLWLLCTSSQREWFFFLDCCLVDRIGFMILNGRLLTYSLFTYKWASASGTRKVE